MKTNILAPSGLFAVAICIGTCQVMAVSPPIRNLFVANFGSGDITEITPGGSESTFASGFSDPSGLAFNSAGDLFVASGGISGTITEITPNGTKSTFASGLNNPIGLAFNSAGDLFVAIQASSIGSGSIVKITPNGTQSTFAMVANPYGLAFNSAGNLFVGSIGNNNAIVEITPGGLESTFASGLDWPTALAFNSAGDLFVASEQNSTIYEYTPNGTRSTYASVFAPWGLACDSAGNVYETDSYLNSVTVITPDGTQSTYASGLTDPIGLAFQGVGLPVPEPTVLAVLGAGALMLVIRSGKHFPLAKIITRIPKECVAVASCKTREVAGIVRTSTA